MNPRTIIAIVASVILSASAHAESVWSIVGTWLKEDSPVRVEYCFDGRGQFNGYVTLGSGNRVLVAASKWKVEANTLVLYDMTMPERGGRVELSLEKKTTNEIVLRELRTKTISKWKRANQSLESTSPAVTPRADAQLAPAAVVAHL